MPTIRRIITASLAAVAAVSLAACDAEQIGSAVVIDGERYTVEDLQNEVDHVEQLEGFDVEAAGGMPAFQRQVLTRYIQHQIFLRLAEDEGIEVTEADIDAAIEQFEQQSGGDLTPALEQSGYTEDAFRAGVADQLIAEAYAADTGADNAVLTQTIIEVGDSMDIEVNPRYGTWGEDLAVSADTGSISEPAQ